MRTPAGLRALPTLVVGVVLALGSLAITRASLVYFGDYGEALPPFLIEKLPMPREELYFFLLKVHVIAASFALPACVALLSTALLRRAPRLHRWLGRAAGVVVLAALVPSGGYLALHAKFGLPSTLGFFLTGAIVAVAMVQGVRTARAGRFVEHRRWVLHVLAQLAVAVVSRAMLVAFDAAGVGEELAYLVSLWLPVVGGAAVVELVVPRPRTARRTHEAPHAVRDPRPHSRARAVVVG
jgi:hypothetical protein